MSLPPYDPTLDDAATSAGGGDGAPTDPAAAGDDAVWVSFDRGSKTGARVLVVESDDAARYYLSEMLDGPYRVEAVGDQQAALERLTRYAFDALVVGVHLDHGGRGLDLLRIARTLPGYHHVPAIAVAAHGLPAEREELLASGFDGYVRAQGAASELLGALVTVRPPGDLGG